VIRLWLEGWIPPSERDVRRHHWRVEYRNKHKLHWLVKVAMLEQNVVPGMDDLKKRASITVYRPRELDDDNFIGGLKSLVDTLKLEGFFKDDNRKFLDLLYSPKQVATREKKGTEVIIEDVS